ncbi:erythromycin esterase family protein [Streptomyces sp. NPDC001941]|uniref:erythromycin esterase family protein n=1 Tax=Streptomyces sp. NPDC001941 TaxID=3154659 RepID=UPI00332D9DA5
MDLSTHFPETALDALARELAPGAAVVGIGESTRFAHETFALRDRLTRRLVRDHGFRTVAVQDSAGAADALDAYVTHGRGTAESALATAWRPWRTAETAAALDWMRAFNLEHPGDPVRIIGVKPRQAGPEDYDAVLDHVRAAAPHLLPELAGHLDPIRTAHTLDEHVQRARGTHPGRPFTEHARDALALLDALPARARDADVRERMRLIADFHAHSVAGKGDYVNDESVWAATVADRHDRTGRGVVYWDGISHTTAAPVALGIRPDRAPHPTAGSTLRERFGSGYVSVAIGFHHGDLGVVRVPAPARDFLDSALGASAPAAHWIDLRDARARRDWAGPAKARVISGVYRPENDAAEHLAVASLPDAFDVLAHFPEATALSWLD